MTCAQFNSLSRLVHLEIVSTDAVFLGQYYTLRKYRICLYQYGDIFIEVTFDKMTNEVLDFLAVPQIDQSIPWWM